MTGMEFLAQNIVKASALLSAAFAASWVLRNRTAALRHFVWTAVLSALLLLPVLTAVTPKWGWRTMPEAPATVSVRQSAAPIPHAPAPRSFPLRPYGLLLVWAIGFAIAAVRFAGGAARTARMVRRASRAEYAEALGIGGAVPLLESAEVPMPLAWGIRRPVVVLPVEARTWPVERLRTVLLHELTHVERRDLPAQTAGQIACCFYWFHPLAWLAARQLRQERERACDDAVLLHGIPAPDYAAHLVALVRSMAARRTEWAGAAGMAERSDLEARVRALLDRRRARQPLSRPAALAVTAAAIAVLLPLAVLTTYAQPAGGGLAGVVRDPSAAIVPQCEVTAKNLDGSNQEVARCTFAGEYRFASIPPGHYEVEFHAAGFMVQKVQAVVSVGAVSRVDSQLAIGSGTQTVTITGQKPAMAPAVRPAVLPVRIRVGGMVQQFQLIQQVEPEYPADAKQQGVEGNVLIRAVISKTGQVLSPEVVNTVDSRLAKAALDAVTQWTYKPTLLNGEPVETLATITLEFKLVP